MLHIYIKAIKTNNFLLKNNNYLLNLLSSDFLHNLRVAGKTCSLISSFFWVLSVCMGWICHHVCLLSSLLLLMLSSNLSSFFWVVIGLSSGNSWFFFSFYLFVSLVTQVILVFVVLYLLFMSYHVYICRIYLMYTNKIILHHRPIYSLRLKLNNNVT
jgi:hypothetical protein